MQVVDEIAPGTAENVPAAQGAQTALELAPTTPENVPAGHAVTFPEASGQKEPAGHAVQVEDEIAPTAAEKVPAGQSVHLRYPATFEKVPAGHVAHVPDGESSKMYCPGSHEKGKIARRLWLLVSAT